MYAVSQLQGPLQSKGYRNVCSDYKNGVWIILKKTVLKQAQMLRGGGINKMLKWGDFNLDRWLRLPCSLVIQKWRGGLKFNFFLNRHFNDISCYTILILWKLNVGIFYSIQKNCFILGIKYSQTVDLFPFTLLVYYSGTIIFKMM